ncbi:SPFH domain-containing protein [Methanolobus profundi]|uniref:Regulator of protease activity HflC, stomatin/prohibitin superfamily n=1 Tax=Methanolobus profundi TaxID=487685 RepID=A0A1I4P7Q0_9EURY|nr:SPFH domain-containing protein [Methanolobus profundi]SFM23729.1 Regulator of protease activity HflC, stomatin/prohibitin superfamily [Methanolobus profundi]
MAFKWKREADDIARVVPKKQVGGFFSKAVILSPNEKAAMVKNGVVDEIVDSGKLQVGGLLKPGNIGKDVDVAMMDTSPKDLQWEQPELWTRDNQRVACNGLLRFRIQEPKRFFQMLYSYSTPDKKGVRALSVHDIYQRIESEVLTFVLEPEVRQEDIEKLYGNRDLRLNIENELEMRLRSTMSMWGLEMLKYTVQWDLGSYGKVMQATNDFQTREELSELDTLSVEGDLERRGREEVAGMRAGHATIATEKDFHRDQSLKDVKAELEAERLQSEADMREAREAIKLKEELKLAKAKGMRAELEVEQDMKDREHGRDMEYLKHITESGGSDVAKTVSEGREYGRMSPEQLEALAKIKQGEALAKEDKVSFMMEVEDRERDDSYRRQELDAAMMGAAQGKHSPTVRKCPGCGSTVPAESSFCSQCGKRLTDV